MTARLKARYSRDKKPAVRSRRAKFLERAMDFQVPALPQHIRTVLALGTAAEINARRIAAAIHRDYGLTLRLYRVLNSAFFSPGRRQVLSMRFIVVLLGQSNLAKILSGIPVLQGSQPELMQEHGYALMLMARSLVAAEMAFSLSDNYNMQTEKIVPCAILKNSGRIITAFLSSEAGEVMFDDITMELKGKEVKRLTGWMPDELAITLLTRWNLPELAIKNLYHLSEIKQGLSRENYRIVLMAHAVNSLVSLAGQKGTGRRQNDIRVMMIKKLGVSQKGIDKAFQEAVANFRKENPFFSEIIDQNDLLKHLLV